MFYYDVVDDDQTYTSHGTTNTGKPFMALKESTNGFSLTRLSVLGKASGLTSLSSIGFYARRWTTASTGGDSLTASPRNLRNPAASTVCVHDGGSAITPGSGNGAIFLTGTGCAATGPGAWVARDDGPAPLYAAPGSADDFTLYSIAIATSLGFAAGAEIYEK